MDILISMGMFGEFSFIGLLSVLSDNKSWQLSIQDEEHKERKFIFSQFYLLIRY